MAIYHLHAQIIQRSKGKNAVASAAYRRAAALFDEKEQRTWDYTNKQGVIHSEIIVPENAPGWAKDCVALHHREPSRAAEILWNLVEAHEKQVNSQLAREIEFSLPIELNPEQSVQLAREFIHDQFVLRGMIADWNIHWDDGNPHVHLMLTTRSLTEDGFGLKVREWNDKRLLQEWREKWAEYANFHLRLHQHEARIDHRSYEAQGIDLIPTIHQGKAVSDMGRRGIPTAIMKEANDIRRENLSRICANPSILFDKLSVQGNTFTQQQLGQELGRYINDQGRFSVLEKGLLSEEILKDFESLEREIHSHEVLSPEVIGRILSAIEYHESVFNEKALVKAIEPYTTNAEQFAKALIQIKASNELVYLGAGDDGRDRFTTRRMFDLENEIQTLADVMGNAVHVKINHRRIESVIEKYQLRTGNRLTDEQWNAVKHILKPSSISCVVGRAGTGKSFSLGAAKAVWEAQGLRVQGVALSGIAADGLSKDAGIASRTIDSFRYAIEQGKIVLNHHDVVVMDEAGMTDSVSMLAILKATRHARAKLVLVGDHAQIQPVGPGAIFRALVERLGFAELQTVYRQKVEWQAKATVAFSAGRIEDGLLAYEKGDEGGKCIHYEKNAHDAMQRLVNDWFETRILKPKDMKEYLVIAHRNEDVNELNQQIRLARVSRQEIADGYTTHAKHGAMKIAQGDRILFLKNDRALGVSNGRFATIKSVEFTESGNALGFTVILDGTKKEVYINPKSYNDFNYGYAATVHKVQGMTVDHAFVYAGGSSWNRHLTYVAMSRHRWSCHLYADKTLNGDINAVIKKLGKLGIKDSLLDFPLAFAERRGLNVSGLLKLLPKHLAERIAILKEKISNRYEAWINPEKYYQEQERIAREQLAAENITQVREDARLVAAYVDANRELGMSWQALQSKLYNLGLEKISYSAEDFSLISATQEYNTIQDCLNKRNAFSAQIIQNQERYQKALDIYSIDNNKLKKQAESYACYERVNNYYNQCSSVVLRDRLASLINIDIKGHYPYLQKLGISSRDIKTQAQAHHRRHLLKTLTADEKAAFIIVEKYQTASQQAAQLWYDIKPQETSEQIHKYNVIKQQLEKLEKYSLERDLLAYQIINAREKYDKGLDFYQIGLATTHIANIKPTPEEMRRAEARWYKLQQYAARHELRQRVQDYYQAYTENDLTARMRHAYAIIQDTKAHHGAVVGLKSNTPEIWRSIRHDSKLFERHEHYKNLDLIHRIGFKNVEDYIEAKRSHSAAWREIFESRKIAQFDEKILHKKLAAFANSYTRERNSLAEKILSNKTLHEAGLKYFGITVDELSVQAYAHQCFENVQKYISAKGNFEKYDAALSIINDPKSHHGVVIENNLNWRNIYNDAKFAENKKYFESLSSDEKLLIRLADRYRKVNEDVGKSYSKLKSGQINDYANSENKIRLNRLFSKRDYLAWRLVNLAYSLYPNIVKEQMEQLRLNSEKLLQQHSQHIDKLDKVASWQAAQQTIVQSLQHFGHINHKSKEAIESYKSSMKSIIYAQQLQKHIHFDRQLHKFTYALNTYGLSEQMLNKQGDALINLKKSLKLLAAQKGINQELIERTSIKEIKLSMPIVSASSQRIDISRLREDLNLRVEEVAQHYLGDPKERQSNAWRYGSHTGSMIVTTKGNKQGCWYDFQTCQGGDMLGLIQQVLDTTNFKEVLEEATHFLGGSSTYTQEAIVQVERTKEKTDKNDLLILQKIKKAQAIYQNTKPITGTLAERYLREHRGIHGEIYDRTFRFHPNLRNWMTGKNYPALVVVARDTEDFVCGVQAIFLDPETGKKAALGNHAKLSRGAIGEGAVVHMGNSEGKLAFAEGPETALSVAEAHPDWTVYVTFGVSNFDKVPLKANSQSIVICADNDGPGSGTEKSVDRAANILSEKGIDVWVALPRKPENQAKWDFNDSLLAHGVSHVRKVLDNAHLHKAGMTQDVIKMAIATDLSQLNNPVLETRLVEQAQPVNLSKLREMPLNDLFKHYVEMELEQTRLVSIMHAARLKDRQESNSYAAKAMDNANAIRIFAKEAIHHPDIISELEKLKNIKPNSLTQQGGFIALRDRIEAGKLSNEDRHVLIIQLKNKSLDQSRIQVQDRDRGGRSR